MSSEAIAAKRRLDHPHVALVTARAALGLDEDLPPLRDALVEHGARVAAPCWDDADIEWSHFDVAVLRSTWDYAERVGDFLHWAERCARSTLLLNPPEVVRSNVDKHYLVTLARASVPVVPTRFIEPGDTADVALRGLLRGGADALTVGVPQPFAEFVVKPAVGAGSRDAARYAREQFEPACAHIARLLAARRSVMLQPYLARVDDHGETAVVFLDGLLSHAVRKGPLLQPGGGIVAGLFAPEVIAPRELSSTEATAATAAVSALDCGRLLYARVDLIHDHAANPVVLELELAEPSLFFNQAPGSAERFARALLQRLRLSVSAEVNGEVEVNGERPEPRRRL